MLLGQLSALMNTSEQTVHSMTHRHSHSTRERSYLQFWHGGNRVCKKRFTYMHTISEKRLRNLRESLSTNDLTPHCHGNTKRLPSNTISFEDAKRTINFLISHTEANAILLPGRIPGYKRSDLQLLPSSTTKYQVWLQYCASLQSLSTTYQQIAYSTFCTLWRRILPHVIITKPMSDLCWTCQSNNMKILQSANQPEESKSEVMILMYITPFN